MSELGHQHEIDELGNVQFAPQSLSHLPDNIAHEPVNFNASGHGRRVMMTSGTGLHGGSGASDRRNSLASLQMDDFFSRRPSMGLDTNVNVDNLFGRRDSIDSSTTAALDAAIMDITRRRSSAFLGGTGGSMTEMANSSFGHQSLNAGSSITSFGAAPTIDLGRREQGMFGFSALNHAGVTQPHVTSIALRQQQLQQQQRELEQRQRELEIQRQQLLASMSERGFGIPMAIHSGIVGGNTGAIGTRSSFAGTPQTQPRRSNGSSQSWWVCQVCNSKAFSSHDEALAHEGLCQDINRGDLLQQIAYSSQNVDTRASFISFDDSMRSSASSMNVRGSVGSVGQGGDYSERSFDQSSHSIPTQLSHGPFAMLLHPLALAMPSDKDWLTPLHCFVRQYCVEVFTASEGDVQTPSKGKRKPIIVGQIGIRCPHCHNIDSSKARERGSVYYPTTISSIYNATMNLLQRHIHNCPAVPDATMRKYETLKADDARSGTSKRYWVESALSLGLVDTANGIRYSALRPPPLPVLNSDSGPNDLPVHNALVSYQTEGQAADDDGNDASPVDTTEPTKRENDIPKAVQHVESTDETPLVSPEDQSCATNFSHALLSQMQRCIFTEADRLGKRKGLPPGFPGLACRHCFGGYGSGRFFPSSIKTLSDTSKTLNVLHNHMMRCRKCPAEIRDNLEKLRETHDDERSKMKFGSQKAFFGRIWERLHGKELPVPLKRSVNESGMPDHPQQDFYDESGRGSYSVDAAAGYPLTQQSLAGMDGSMRGMSGSFRSHMDVSLRDFNRGELLQQMAYNSQNADTRPSFISFDESMRSRGSAGSGAVGDYSERSFDQSSHSMPTQLSHINIDVLESPIKRLKN